MPILTLKTTATVSDEQAQSLMQQLSQLGARILNKREEVTACVLELIPASRWWVGGESGASVRAQLDIQVTHGTNTQDEKQRFVQQAYGVLQAHFSEPALHPVCYVSVLEVPADGWGYGGLTQQQRSHAAHRAPPLAQFD